MKRFFAIEYPDGFDVTQSVLADALNYWLEDVSEVKVEEFAMSDTEFHDRLRANTIALPGKESL